MHLTINATEIGRQRGGNESYLLGLLRGLEALSVPSRVSLLLTSQGTEACPVEASQRFIPVDLGHYRRLFFYALQQMQVLRRLRPDWYLSTFFLPPLTPCRAAVLVHDMSFRAHPRYFPASVALYMRFLTGMAVRRADRVIALSEFTRREIARFHPQVAHKTAVVYPGVDRAFTDWSGEAEAEADERVLRTYGLAPGYILAIGNIHPRKNLARLLDAYRALREAGPVVPPMVWAGLQRWDSGDLLEQARAAEVVLPGFVPLHDLPALYRQAAMLVYPSLYEGFGLPPLEAMACGTPVVASNTTSLPEAVGEAGLTVDPTSREALAAAMGRLLEDGTLRDDLVRLGHERAGHFTWARTAQRLIALLDS